MKIVAIHQPSYFPWLGLIDKIAKSDYFVFLDHVSLNKGSNQYRNTFFCDGKPVYLTLPVNYNMGKPIIDLHFKNFNWADDHLNKLQNYYKKAKYFDELFPYLRSFFAENRLFTPADVIINSMHLTFQLFGIRKPDFIRSSMLDCEENKGELVLEICKKIGAEYYLSGNGAKSYLDDTLLQKFNSYGIKIIWQAFNHPAYEQNPRYPFLAGLSSLDILFFNGIEKSRLIFWNNIKSTGYAKNEQ